MRLSEELGIVADAALGAANRASDAIDEVLAFVEASNQRIAAMEAQAGKNRFSCLKPDGREKNEK